MAAADELTVDERKQLHREAIATALGVSVADLYRAAEATQPGSARRERHVVTVRGAADLMQCTPKSIYEWLRDGKASFAYCPSCRTLCVDVETLTQTRASQKKHRDSANDLAIAKTS